MWRWRERCRYLREPDERTDLNDGALVAPLLDHGAVERRERGPFAPTHLMCAGNAKANGSGNKSDADAEVRMRMCERNGSRSRGEA